MTKIGILCLIVLLSFRVTENKKDKSSYSNIKKIITEHLNLKWFVDFESKRLAGEVELIMIAKKRVKRIKLDMSGLRI